MNWPGKNRPWIVRTPKFLESVREKSRRNPKRCIHNLNKETRVLYGTISTLIRKKPKMPPFKHARKQQLSSQVVDKQFQRSQFLLSLIQNAPLPNFVFSDEKKVDVEHHFKPETIGFAIEIGMKDPKLWQGINVSPHWWSGHSGQSWQSPVEVNSSLLSRRRNWTSKTIMLTFSFAHFHPGHRRNS